MKKKITSLLNKLPYIRGLYNDILYYKSYSRFAPEHYHNPIPNTLEVEELYKSEYFEEMNGIDFDFKNQLNLLEKFNDYYSEMPWDFNNDLKNNHLRYKNKGSYYRYSDAIFLYSIMRNFKPKRIIEIGSGFSSAIMLDTNDGFFRDSKIDFTFIEPNPQDRLNDLLKEEDKFNCKIIPDRVQNVDVSIYSKLEENDILFVDSSHITKTGSDLNFILFNILPILKKGVLIHFHDVFYPFDYPKSWILDEKFYWNEPYILRAFMMYNSQFKLLFFNSAAHKFHLDYLKSQMPETLKDHENSGAIWIKKV